MDNPFKKLDEPHVEVPQDLKKKVMDDVAAFKLFSDVVGFFSSNYIKVVESFFKQRDKNKTIN